MTQSLISAYERGQRSPRRETVLALADALGIDDESDAGRDARRADAIRAWAGLEYSLPEMERIPDEDELERRLAAYDGPNPGLRAAQGALAGFLHAVRTSERVPPPDDL